MRYTFSLLHFGQVVLIAVSMLSEFLVINRHISTAQSAGIRSDLAAAIPFLHDVRMITVLVAPLGGRFRLHLQKRFCVHAEAPWHVQRMIRG